MITRCHLIIDKTYILPIKIWGRTLPQNHTGEIVLLAAVPDRWHEAMGAT
jgi:hypothetical protein